MKSSFQAYETPQFRVLSDDQIYEIHLASLEILERTGVNVYEKEALSLLGDAGARIGKNERVRIPSYMV